MIRQQSFKNNKPTLFLVATPIGNLQEFSPRAIETLKSVDTILCEDTRTTKSLLDKFEIKNNLVSYHKFNERQMCDKVIEHLHSGQDIALVSDAGYPSISDPGNILVKEVIQQGYNVTCVNGSNALLPALVCSGLDTNHFFFYGFLESKETAKSKELETLKNYDATLVFYESANRINETIKCIYKTLGNRDVVIAREITKQYEEYIRATAEELVNTPLELKGECVLLVSGFKEEKKEIDEIIKETMQDLLSHGYKLKEACQLLSKLKNINKNELYNYFVKQ